MKRKIVSAICFGLMLASLLVFAGCSGGSGSDSSSGTSSISGSGE